MVFERNLRLLFILMIGGFFLFQNCATIVRGTSQKIPVTSNPIGAKIIVDGKEVGTTPLHLKLKRKKIHHVQIEKEGYEPFALVINRKTSMLPSLLGNGFIGGNIGVAIAHAALPEEKLSWGSGKFMETRTLLGFLVGWGTAMAIDFITGANYNLSPDNLVLSLSKGSEKSQSSLIMIDEEHFEKIKWIRIRFEDSDEEKKFLIYTRNIIRKYSSMDSGQV